MRGASTRSRARRRIGALLLVCALTASVASGNAGAAGAAPTAAAYAENAFALSLFSHLSGGDGNLVYSPYSVDTALTMVDAGATGRTATQINHVLGAASSAAATTNARALRRVMRGAAAGAGTANAPTLELANALWTQQGVTLQAPFVATLSDAFGAPPQATDFRGAPQAARQTINSWVSRNTVGLIPNLLPQGSVSASTVLVLANAIYLKAHWASPFDVQLTHAAPFTTASGTSVSAQFMSTNDAAYRYAAAAHYQAVDLPYESSSLSLLAILPTGESLARFSSTFNAGRLQSLVASLRLRRVNLRMPKIQLHTQTTLNAPLEALGMRDAFGAAANFSGITTQAPLQISLVEHAADLKVDEQGTVAAAATGIVGPTAIALPPGPMVTVNLDRPYLLLLREDSSGAILFAARVANPDVG